MLTFDELVRKIHWTYHAKNARIIHLPVKTLIAILSRLERAAFRVLPVTAGQLAAFVNDSVARHDPSLAPYVGHRTGVDDMLRLLEPNA